MSSIVYVLTNPAMPGIVKIGKTNRDDPQVRMNELYTTGVPLPFECAIAVETDDKGAEGLEKALHAAFGPSRVNPSREFFKIETYQAEAILQAWPGKDVTPLVNKATEELAPADIEAVKIYKSRSPNLNFREMGMEVDSVLVSIDSGEQATVIGDRKVLFRGEEVSLTTATMTATGRTYATRPTGHWTFEGRNLAEIYNETYFG